MGIIASQLSKLSNHVIIFQYPVRPCSMSYDSVEVLDSKVKSKQQQVEITLSLNTNSSNYDESKGKLYIAY